MCPQKVPTHRPGHASLPVHRPPPRPRSGDDAAWKRLIDGRPWRKLSALYRKAAAGVRVVPVGP